MDRSDTEPLDPEPSAFDTLFPGTRASLDRLAIRPVVES